MEGDENSKYVQGLVTTKTRIAMLQKKKNRNGGNCYVKLLGSK